MFRKLQVQVIILSFLGTLYYSLILFGFFQQDEWLVFGKYYSLMDLPIYEVIKSFVAPDTGHYVPLSRITAFLLFSIFKINYFPYALISIFAHITISCVLLIFLRKILKNNYTALMGSIIFLIHPSSTQATSWIFANINNHGATFFSLLSLLFADKYLSHKTIKNWYLLLSIIFFGISLLFKEVAIGLVLLIPIYAILFYRKHTTQTTRVVLTSFIFGIFYVFVRAYMLMNAKTGSTPILVDTSFPRYQILNFFLYPINSITQSIFPPQPLLALSKYIALVLSLFIKNIPTPQTSEFDVFVLKKIFITLNIFISFAGVISFYSLLKKSRKVFFLGFSWIILNSYVFMLSPERTGVVTVIDSRNMYFLLIGYVVMFSYLLQEYLIDTKNKYANIVLSLYLFMFSFSFLQIEYPRMQEGRLRRSILASVHSYFPDLPTKAVFYAESDKSYYGLPAEDRILPFQSGLGQTLLVSYQDNEKYADEFLQKKFLWEIKDQDYKAYGGRGFGFYRDFDLLVASIDANKLPLEAIYAFSYDSDTKSVKDKSSEVKGRILGKNSQKKLIDVSNIKVYSKLNSGDLKNIVDKNVKTYWDSKLPYSNVQSIDIELPRMMEIAQINVNSYNNKDQNESGFRILLSSDKDNLFSVYEVKRSHRDADGIFKLYFKPTKAKYIRLQQIGYHKFASWVIHEIEIYEAFPN